MSSHKKAEDIKRVAVVGGGSWGTALASHLARKMLEVDLWAFEPEVVDQIKTARENKMYLAEIELPDRIHPSSDLEAVVTGQDIIIMAVPSHHMRRVLGEMIPYIPSGVILTSAAKGIENESLMTMSQVFEDVLPDDLAVHRSVLSGPSFAREVGRGLPTAVTVACPDQEASKLVQQVVSSPTLRIYTTQDLIGVELAGALKNVIAIGAGISDGLGIGLNGRAALITRGLAEIMRLGVLMGANPLTFSGLAGTGDLFLTCTGDLSRNRTVGLRLGKGEKLADILGSTNTVAEGVKTSRSAYNLALREKVDMPLTEKLYQMLYEDMSPMDALFSLMSRDLKPEVYT